MELGKKQTLTGTVERRRINIGSKSERDAIVIMLDNHQAPHFELRIKGQHPFEVHKDLEGFVGKRVSVTGTLGSGVLALFVDKLTDIAVITTPLDNNKGWGHGQDRQKPPRL
jgi:hypothetical protein